MIHHLAAADSNEVACILLALHARTGKPGGLLGLQGSQRGLVLWLWLVVVGVKRVHSSLNPLVSTLAAILPSPPALVKGFF
ncbi:MAG: hypothetical protein RMN53_07140, partial [Anaerolineae bacterium]|nr:hypothetical protein [Anaerolineae bacterium]